jgi:hypothetical protein
MLKGKNTHLLSHLICFEKSGLDVPQNASRYYTYYILSVCPVSLSFYLNSIACNPLRRLI